MAGDAVVFKQDSEYYEHFYNELKPNVHYIPIRADLSDLVEKIRWAKAHDTEVRQIGSNGRLYATENLLPKDIICYHAVLLKVRLNFYVIKITDVIKLYSHMQKWSQKLINPVRILHNMTLLTPSKSADKHSSCPCSQSSLHSEL